MIQFYKPTARNTGCAMSFRASDRDGHLYVSMIRQFSWDAARRKGSFSENRNKPGMSIIIKFSQIEAGRWIDAIERYYAFEGIHSTEKRRINFSFGPAEGEQFTTFVFRVTQTNVEDTTQKYSFFIPVDFGEARLIKEYLVHYLHKSFRFVTPEEARAAESRAVVARQDPPPEQPQEQPQEPPVSGDPLDPTPEASVAAPPPADPLDVPEQEQSGGGSDW